MSQQPRTRQRPLRVLPGVLTIAMLAAACGNAPAGGTDAPGPTSGPTIAAPTPTPTPKITPIPMDVLEEEFTATVAQNKTASVTVRTDPGAKCSIEVLYDSGPSAAAGLDDKAASSAGKVIWSWRVGSNTAPGVYPITIVCTLDGHEGTLELDFTVTR